MGRSAADKSAGSENGGRSERLSDHLVRYLFAGLDPLTIKGNIDLSIRADKLLLRAKISRGQHGGILASVTARRQAILQGGQVEEMTSLIEAQRKEIAALRERVRGRALVDVGPPPDDRTKGMPPGEGGLQ